jgi:hypothetical protein
VAFERYSNTYKTVQIAQLSTFALSSVVPLSTFSQDWGWGLVLPPSVSGINVRYYYDFYAYNNLENSGIYDSTINWNDILTLTPYASTNYANWTSEGGTMDNLITYELIKGLDLLP